MRILRIGSIERLDGSTRPSDVEETVPPSRSEVGMAAPRTPRGNSDQKGRSSDSAWAKLTWTDLANWTGSRTIARGRSYQRGGRVRDLRISRVGELLATV